MSEILNPTKFVIEPKKLKGQVDNMDLVWIGQVIVAMETK